MLLAGGLPAQTAPAAWWDPGWSCRREVFLEPGGNTSRVAAVEMPTLGKVNGDGSDVRVISGGVVLKHQVLWVGPDDRMKIVFEMPAGAAPVHSYFGNPKAKPLGSWEVPAGLILETRSYAGVAVGTLAEFRKAFDRAGKQEGRDLVGQVQFGYNPFGPSQNFLSRFTGWLQCPTDGSYEFATSSDDASFLLVDGQEVCSWPGEHPAIRDARHTGKIDLTAGAHRFEYCHQQLGGDCFMVAAWNPPGRPAGQVVPIPPDAFLPVVPARLGPVELSNGDWVPDFLAQNVGEAVLTPEDDRHLVRMHFENLTGPDRLKEGKVAWSFGDGTTSSEVSPDHVYLVEGTYQVSLTVDGSGGRRSVGARVDARRSFARQASAIDDRAGYESIIRSYDFKGMPVEQLYWGMYYFDRIGRPDDVIAAGRELISRKDLADEAIAFDAVMLLGETERMKGTDFAGVQKLYEDFETRLKDPAHRATLALARGDLYQWHLKDLVRAEGCYRHILADYRDTAKPETRRKALYRLGEIYRWRGDGVKTREFFERAGRIPVNDLTAAQRKVRPGYLARAIEDYIRSDQMNDAYQLLTQWAWEYPTDMLEGYWSSLRIQWLIKNKEYPGGIDEAETLLKVNPQSTYAVRVLMLAADCAETLNQSDRVRKLLQRALVEYPESPDRAAVQERLEPKK